MSGAASDACAAINCCGEGPVPNRPVKLLPFPSNPERCKVWVLRCRRLDLFSKAPSVLSKHYVLCEKHFENKGRNQRVAIPTLFDFPKVHLDVPPRTQNQSLEVNDGSQVTLPGGVKMESLTRIVTMSEGVHFVSGGPLLEPGSLNPCSKTNLLLKCHCQPYSLNSGVGSILVGLVGSVSQSGLYVRNVRVHNIHLDYVSDWKNPNWRQDYYVGQEIPYSSCEVIQITGNSFTENILFDDFISRALLEKLTNHLLQERDGESTSSKSNFRSSFNRKKQTAVRGRYRLIRPKHTDPFPSERVKVQNDAVKTVVTACSNDSVRDKDKRSDLDVVEKVSSNLTNDTAEVEERRHTISNTSPPSLVDNEATPSEPSHNLPVSSAVRKVKSYQKKTFKRAVNQTNFKNLILMKHLCVEETGISKGCNAVHETMYGPKAGKATTPFQVVLSDELDLSSINIDKSDSIKHKSFNEYIKQVCSVPGDRALIDTLNQFVSHGKTHYLARRTNTCSGVRISGNTDSSDVVSEGDMVRGLESWRAWELCAKTKSTCEETTIDDPVKMEPPDDFKLCYDTISIDEHSVDLDDEPTALDAPTTALSVPSWAVVLPNSSAQAIPPSQVSDPSQQVENIIRQITPFNRVTLHGDKITSRYLKSTSLDSHVFTSQEFKIGPGRNYSISEMSRNSSDIPEHIKDAIRLTNNRLSKVLMITEDNSHRSESAENSDSLANTCINDLNLPAPSAETGQISSSNNITQSGMLDNVINTNSFCVSETEMLDVPCTISDVSCNVESLVRRIVSSHKVTVHEGEVESDEFLQNIDSATLSNISHVFTPNRYGIKPERSYSISQVCRESDDIPRHIKKIVRSSGDKLCKVFMIVENDYPSTESAVHLKNTLQEPLTRSCEEGLAIDSTSCSVPITPQADFTVEVTSSEVENDVTIPLLLSDTNNLESQEGSELCGVTDASSTHHPRDDPSPYSQATVQNNVTRVSIDDENLPAHLKNLIEEASSKGAKVTLLQCPTSKIKDASGNESVSIDLRQVLTSADSTNSKVVESATCHGDNHSDLSFTALAPLKLKDEPNEIQVSNGGSDPSRHSHCFCRGFPVPESLQYYATPSRIGKIAAPYENLAKEFMNVRIQLVKHRKEVARLRSEREKMRKRKRPIKLLDILLELESVLRPDTFNLIVPTIVSSWKQINHKGMRYSEQLKDIGVKVALSGGWLTYKYLSRLLSLPSRTTLINFLEEQKKKDRATAAEMLPPDIDQSTNPLNNSHFVYNHYWGKKIMSPGNKNETPAVKKKRIRTKKKKRRLEEPAEPPTPSLMDIVDSNHFSEERVRVETISPAKSDQSSYDSQQELQLCNTSMPLLFVEIKTEN